MTTRLSNAERFRRTRRALLDAGRALFADVGYARTTTGALVRRAGVTRGARHRRTTESKRVALKPVREMTLLPLATLCATLSCGAFGLLLFVAWRGQ